MNTAESALDNFLLLYLLSGGAIGLSLLCYIWYIGASPKAGLLLFVLRSAWLLGVFNYALIVLLYLLWLLVAKCQAKCTDVLLALVYVHLPITHAILGLGVAGLAVYKALDLIKGNT